MYSSCVFDLFWGGVSFTEHGTTPLSLSLFSLSLPLSRLHTRRHTGHGCFHVTTHQHCTDEWSGRWAEWVEGREKAMKGKDEESGLEKRQNREVGQRQATSVFCARRDIPMHSCPKRWRRWMTAMLLMTPRARQKSHFHPPCFLILHLLPPVQS